MTTTQFTVATAPRDAAALEKSGRFNLRVLAQELGIFAANESKQAFLSMDAKTMADTVLQNLLAVDGKKPSNGAAVAAGGAAKRQPSNSGSKRGTATAAAASNEGSSAQAGAGAEKLLAAIQQNSEALQGVREAVEVMSETLAGLTGHIAGTNKLVALDIQLALTMAEQVLNAPPVQVLAAAIEDLGGIEPQLRDLVGGGEPDEEEGDGEEAEGND